MNLREHLRNDPLTELRLRPLVTVFPHTPIQQAAASMRQQGVGAVVVIDPATHQPVGMFNERRLIRALATIDHAMSKPVSDHMVQPVTCLRRDEPIAHLIRAMKRHQVRSVCVTDEAGKPVALAGVRALIEYIAEFFARQIKVQPLDSTIAMQEREGA